MLLVFSECGPQDPLRKSGRRWTVHSEHIHRHWLGPCSTGAVGEVLNPFGLSSCVLSVMEECRYK